MLEFNSWIVIFIKNRYNPKNKGIWRRRKLPWQSSITILYNSFTLQFYIYILTNYIQKNKLLRKKSEIEGKGSLNKHALYMQPYIYIDRSYNYRLQSDGFPDTCCQCKILHSASIKWLSLSYNARWSHLMMSSAQFNHLRLQGRLTKDMVYTIGWLMKTKKTIVASTIKTVVTKIEGLSK